MLLHRGVGPAEDPGKHVFVSYSHDDGEYVERLREGLSDRVNVWIDRTEIPGSAPWREEVADGIRRSDVFLFVISPRSVASTECGLELDLATEYGKRIVPLVLEPVPEGDLPEALAARQWTDGGDIAELVRVLQLDLPRVHRHTLLLVQAHEWRVNGRRRSALLRGGELRSARRWLAAGEADVEPHPTELQREYLAKGRVAARQRWGLGTVVTAVLVTVALIVGFSQMETAHQNRSRELATRSEDALRDGLDRALLLGREAAAERPTVEARRALLTALRTRPRQVGYLDALAGVPTEQREDPGNHLPLAVQPGGRLLAVPVSTGMRFVTLPTGKPAWTVRSLSATPAFSPDGRWLAVATHSDPRRLELIDVAARRVVEQLTVPQSHGLPKGEETWSIPSPDAVSFSGDGATVAIPANDTTVRIWNLRERTWSQPFGGHGATYTTDLLRVQNVIDAVALSPDGRLLASGDWRGEVLIRNVRSGRLLTRLTVKADKDERASNVESLAFHPKGDYLAAGTANQTLAVWRTKDWSRVVNPSPDGARNPIQSLAFSPDGRVLVTAGWRTGPLLREVGSWKTLGDRLPNDNLSGTSIAFLDQGTSMLWGVQGTGRFAVWNVGGPGPLGEVVRGSPKDAVALAVSRRSGGPFAVGGAEGVITVGELTLTHELNHRLQEEYLQSLALSQDERTLFSAADDGSVNEWDISSGTRRSRWSVASGTSAIALGDHGRLVAAATFDDEIVVRRVSDHTLLAKVPEGEKNVVELAFSPDGSLLVAGAELGTAVLVDVAGGRVLGTLRGYTSDIRGLAFSPDGRTVVVGSEDGTYAFWDVADRQRIGDRMPAHIGMVLSAEFSPDGRLLALGGDQGRVLLVDVETRRALGPTLAADTGAVECRGSPCRPVWDMAFTHDGKQLLSATDAVDHITTQALEVVLDPSTVRQPGATRWSTDLTSWLQAACTRASRTLTPTERDRYGIDSPTPCTL